MVGEKPPFFSFEDAYLQVADVCNRAGYLERLNHALGKLPVSGRPNGRGKRRDIPLLELIDYRLAFGTDGRGAMAVHKNLAAKWLHDGRSIAHLLAGGPPLRSTPAPEPGRRLLAENVTEIDDRAWRAIRRAIRRAARAPAKPDDASLVFTDLQLGAKEFLKLFHKGPGAAPADARALTTAASRKKYDTEKMKAAKTVLKQVFPEGRPEDMPPAEFLRIVHGSEAFLSLSKEKQPSESTFRRAGGYRI
jgi:hypothetical protein